VPTAACKRMSRRRWQPQDICDAIPVVTQTSGAINAASTITLPDDLRSRQSYIKYGKAVSLNYYALIGRWVELRRVAVTHFEPHRDVHPKAYSPITL
jgi:hypothetical protein